jgi:serine/threonine protein phosphatase PrpC
LNTCYAVQADHELHKLQSSDNLLPLLFTYFPSCIPAGVYPFSDCTKDNPEIHTVLEHGYGRQELATAVAAEGLRPSLPKSAPAGLVELLQAAWSLDPAARPTAAQMRDGLAELLQQALQQQQVQQQVCGAAHQQQQQNEGMVVVHACCDGSSDDDSSAMEVDAAAAAASPVAAAKPHPLLQQQQQHDWDISGACSSAASDIFIPDIPEDSETLASTTLSLLPHGQQQQQQRLRRIPRSSSASTLSSVPDTGLGFGASGDISSSHSSKPLSTEAANAAAAAAAAAAVPAAASLQGVLSLTAAAAAGGAAAAAVESGAFGALGPRESMEDRHVVVQGLGGDARVTLAAVFDGHRGHEAAAYAAAQLPRNLLLSSVLEGSSSSGNAAVVGAASKHPSADDITGAARALKRSFLATDAAFWQEWQAEMHAHATAGQYTERYPGCTALAAVLAGSQLFVANAGDGRAVLSREGSAVPLSRQHTADLQDERQRVVAAGGTVAYRGGSWRVGTAALQVTRALGDFDLKAPAQQRGQQQRGQQQQQQQQQQQRVSPYSSNPLSCSTSSSSLISSSSMPVTAEPEVVSLQLSGADQFLILGTDGLWDVIGDQEAVGLVHDTVKDPFLCAKRLVMEALSRGSSDNVSAVVLFLQPKHTLERVWVRGGGSAVPAATPTFYGSRRLTTQQAAEQAGDGAAAAAGPAQVADEMMDTY